jgi:hypothetical protein
MPKTISHEEIAERFVQAKVVDFNALGKLITEIGPALAVNDQGWHGVSFGRWNWLACYWRVEDLTRIIDIRAAGQASAAIDSATSSLPR